MPLTRTSAEPASDEQDEQPVDADNRSAVDSDATGGDTSMRVTAESGAGDATDSAQADAQPKKTRARTVKARTTRARQSAGEAAPTTSTDADDSAAAPAEASSEASADAEADAPAETPAEKPKSRRPSKAESEKAEKAEKAETESSPTTDGSTETIDTDEEPNVTFEDLGLTEPLLKSLKAVGYEAPTPIQEATIPPLLASRDVIAQAQTGSGKTAAFGLPIIEMIDPADRRVQALILCPTRELAIQVAEALHKYGRHKEVETLPIYGGQAYERQFRGLQRGAQIVVGTPGRVMDHMRRGSLSLDAARFFILDEADEMLDMGFIDDVDWILNQVPTGRQMALFSATMPPRIAELARNHMHDPERITVRGKEVTVPTTTQIAYEVPRSRKVDALNRILDAEEPSSAMIFCRTKNGVDELGEALLARGYAVETLHGDLSQAQRDRVMRRFRGGQAEILIATDVAARGLDIPDVSHVINFDIPESTEAYVHRIGRTGRAGRTGVAITLVSPRELRWLRMIERATRGKIEVRRLPTLADVADRRREAMKTLILDQITDESNYEPYLELVEELTENHDMSAVAAAALKLYADETGRGAIADPKEDDLATFGSAQRGKSEQGMTRLFLNIGRAQGIRPQDIVGAIANEAGIPGRSIGAIDILDTTTFVDVPTGSVDAVLAAMETTRLKGKPVTAEVSTEAPRTGGRPERGGRDFGGDRRDRPADRGPRQFRDRDRDSFGGDRGGYDRGPRDNRFERDRPDDRGPRQYRDRDDRGPRPFRDDRGPRNSFDRGGYDRGPRDERFARDDRGPRRFDNDGGNFDRPPGPRNQQPYRPFQRGSRDEGGAGE